LHDGYKQSKQKYLTIDLQVKIEYMVGPFYQRADFPQIKVQKIAKNFGKMDSLEVHIAGHMRMVSQQIEE